MIVFLTIAVVILTAFSLLTITALGNAITRLEALAQKVDSIDLTLAQHIMSEGIGSNYRVKVGGKKVL